MLAVLIATSSAVHAQSVTADPTIIPHCLATEADQTQCIARMSNHCQQTNDGGETTLGIRLCIIEEWHVWDAMLNEAYSDLLVQSSTMDRAEGDWAKNLRPRVETLREAQRAWIAFRDTECAFAVAQWGTGSIRSIAGAACQRDLTAKRYFDLQEHLSIGEGN